MIHPIFIFFFPILLFVLSIMFFLFVPSPPIDEENEIGWGFDDPFF